MDLEKSPADRPARQTPEGCLVVAIRLPVRIVALVLIVPVRMVWDALVVAWRFLTDTVFRPVGRALGWLARAVFVWPFVGLWRYGVVPLGKALGWLFGVLVVVPLVWLYRSVLTPVGHGLVWAVRSFGDGLVWVYARVLTPLGHGVVWVLHGVVWVLTPLGRAVVWCAKGLAWVASTIVTGIGVGLSGIGVGLYWIARVLLVLPALALWRWVFVPVGRALAVVGREVADAVGHAWRVASRISLAVGRFLGTLFRWIFVEPVRWVYRTVLTPVGHVVRDAVVRPVAEVARTVGRAGREALAAARESVRQARADFRRMLFGEPAPVEAVGRREPSGPETRTLGSSTTALTKD
ncbi:hypothetical protein [Streptomyces pseudovenezuelae]|uniref:Integral membrane protein n=1 Tax=Streptomyces pseudovenezuelae TaxID=67350 RepID=A0ABT6LHB0_9ACTN|nr:hypothetical protein [Streptomyces pseudovenezuelae]MDH6215679.1 hypothetical protein [Streptomyces pseudovenezuelae]